MGAVVCALWIRSYEDFVWNSMVVIIWHCNTTVTTTAVKKNYKKWLTSAFHLSLHWYIAWVAHQRAANKGKGGKVKLGTNPGPAESLCQEQRNPEPLLTSDSRASGSKAPEPRVPSTVGFEQGLSAVAVGLPTDHDRQPREEERGPDTLFSCTLTVTGPLIRS